MAYKYTENENITQHTAHSTPSDHHHNRVHALIRYTTSHTRTAPPSEPVTIITAFGFAPSSLLPLLLLLL